MSTNVTEINKSTHAHYCAFCASQGVETIWAHGNENAGKLDQHRCPRCGHVEWVKAQITSGQLPQAQQQPYVVQVVTLKEARDAFLAYCLILVITMAIVKFWPQILAFTKTVFAKKVK